MNRPIGKFSETQELGLEKKEVDNCLCASSSCSFLICDQFSNFLIGGKLH